MKIEMGKLYKTRQGRKARIYALDGGTDGSVIHGAIEDVGWVSIADWAVNGLYLPSGGHHMNDLISEWEEPRKKKGELQVGDKVRLYWSGHITMKGSLMFKHPDGFFKFVDEGGNSFDVAPKQCRRLVKKGEK